MIIVIVDTNRHDMRRQDHQVFCLMITLKDISRVHPLHDIPYIWVRISLNRSGYVTILRGCGYQWPHGYDMEATIILLYHDHLRQGLRSNDDWTHSQWSKAFVMSSIHADRIQIDPRETFPSSKCHSSEERSSDASVQVWEFSHPSP